MNEVVTVSADADKQIDLRTTTIAHNVTAEELDRMPKARSFQDIALTSPGVNKGDVEGGFQVNGASGAENSFTVDGVSTNSLLYGGSRQDTVFEYLQEVQVKTGGIAAEYGGALGGVISAVTKSGGNKFTGEAHYYYSGSAISASPVPRLQLSPLDDTTVFDVQDENQDNNRNEIGGSIGGPIVRDRLFFFASVSPRFVRRTNDYLFSNGTEPGSIPQKQTATQAFGKVTYGSRRLQANVSVLATPIRSEGTLTAYDGTGPQFVSSSLAGNSAQLARGYDQDQTNVSGNLDFFLSGAASISVRGGMFRDNYMDTGVPTTTAVVWNTPSIGVAGVPAELQLPKGAQNTPRVIITNKDQTQTGFFQVDYNHAFNAAGSHLLKGGFGVRHTTNEVDSSYPGGYVLLNWGTSFVNNSGADRHRHLRLLRGERSRHARLGRRQHAVAVRAGHLDGRQPPHAESRRAHRTRNDSVVPHRREGGGVRIRLRQEDRAAAGRDLRRARQRPPQGVRQLGPLLRLGQVRAGARLLRRRHLAGQLPLARHAGRLQPEPVEHARPGPVGRRARSPRAELRHHRSGPQADVPGFDQRRHRVPAHADDRTRRQLRPQQADPRDRGRRLARRDRQRGLLRRQPRRRRGPDDVRDRADDAVPRRRSRCGSTTRSTSRSAAASRTTGSAAPT